MRAVPPALVLTLPALAQAPFAPLRLDDGWGVVTPAEAGVDGPRLQAALAALMDGRLNVHAALLVRHGKLVAEAYRRGADKPQTAWFTRTVAFGPSTAHDTRSVGKSVIALLLGVAEAEGKLGSLDAPAIAWFPELRDLDTPERRRLTLRHLLTMSGGFEWHESGVGFPNDEDRLAWKGDPARFVLSRPFVAEPGTRFEYCSGATWVLAEVLRRATGQPWTDYAQARLFGPLGIRSATWTTDLRGRPMPNSGLRLTPRDMARLAALLLARGRWQGKALVPGPWIDQMMRPGLPTGFEGTRYGGQCWTGTVSWGDRDRPWAAAFGNGGQRIYVVPELDLGIIFTAGAYGHLPTARALQRAFEGLVGCVRP